MGPVNLFKKCFLMALFLTVFILVFVWTNIGIFSSSRAVQAVQPFVGATKSNTPRLPFVPSRHHSKLPLHHHSSSHHTSFNNILPQAERLKVKNKLCYVNYDDDRGHLNNKTDMKMIYFITPTYPRPEQVPELTRLAHTLMHVPRIHWIIADDQPLCSDQVFNILRRTGIPFTHISSPKPFAYRGTNFPRGVSNRRAALSWLRTNVQDGVMYFGDDDNTVDLQLFDEIRHTKKVSMFPVGLVGGYGVSTPIVNNGKVVAFFDSWPAARKFPVDMAGFAVNLEYLTPSASMPFIAGHEEDRFLISLGLKLEDIEPLASNCSKILVWHTRTVKYKKPKLNVNVHMLENEPNYLYFSKLLNETAKLGMASFFSNNGTKPFVTRNRKSMVISGLH